MDLIRIMNESNDIAESEYKRYIGKRDLKESKIEIEFTKIHKQLQNKEIPNKYNEELLNYDKYRANFISQQGFVLLTNEWIDEFANWIGNRKCIEVLAGCGSLSKVLKDRNVDIIATDDFSWDGTPNWNHDRSYWTSIENIDCAKAIEKYKDRDIVIMSWALYETAYNCLLKMREVNPNMLMVFIGEEKHGCTADDDFFDNMKIINDKDIYNIDCKIPRWKNTYDHIILVK